MPVTIVFTDSGIIPAIFQTYTDEEMIASLNGLAFSPTITTIEDAQTWLKSLPSPSGWFDSVEQAQTEVNRKRSEIPRADQIKKARETLKLSKKQFALELGYTGNDGTNYKHIQQLENGKRNLSVDKAEILKRLMAEHKLIGLAAE